MGPQLVRQTLVNQARSAGRVVLFAHHGDDVVETALFRMARGSSAGRLAGMREFDRGVWRPFLQLNRNELAEFARAESIQHRHDSSNDKLMYSRNQIRLQIFTKIC